MMRVQHVPFMDKPRLVLSLLTDPNTNGFLTIMTVGGACSKKSCNATLQASKPIAISLFTQRTLRKSPNQQDSPAVQPVRCLELTRR